MSVASWAPEIRDPEAKLHAREAVNSYRVSIRGDDSIAKSCNLPSPGLVGGKLAATPLLGKARDSLKSYLLPAHASRTLRMG